MRRPTSQDGWQDFVNLCVEIKSAHILDQLFDLFLTIEEQETLAKRFQIVKALEEGRLTQREIAQKYNVSISQITRGSNALKITSSELKSYLKKNFE